MQTKTKRLLGLAAVVAVTATATAGALGGLDPEQRRQMRAERAHRDSYPQYAYRPTISVNDTALGRVLPMGKEFSICVFARNRYTGEVRQIFHPNVSNREVARVVTLCEPMYQRFLRERSQ